MIEFHDVYSTPGSSDILWDLLLERAEDHGVNISFSMPTRDEHEDFMNSSPYAHWYLVRDEDGQWLGHVYAGWFNEIGIWLFREHRRHGHGRVILKKILEEARPLHSIPGERLGHFIANINPLNERSIHLFESLGFKHIQNTYSYEP
jgi:RimJ/RimL family protein N-acetyltransferase